MNKRDSFNPDMMSNHDDFLSAHDETLNLDANDHNNIKPRLTTLTDH